MQHATCLLSDWLLRYAFCFGRHVSDVVKLELNLDPLTVQQESDVGIADVHHQADATKASRNFTTTAVNNPQSGEPSVTRSL